MFDKLRQLEERYAELHRRLSEPQVIGQASEYARTAKAAAELSEVVEKFGDYKGVLQRLSEARHILAEDADREMRRGGRTCRPAEPLGGGAAGAPPSS
jgi:peptide chain release factor 1